MKATNENRDQSKNRLHQDVRPIRMSKNTEKSLGELGRLAVTCCDMDSREKNHQLKLPWKTRKKEGGKRLTSIEDSIASIRRFEEDIKGAKKD